MTAEPDARGGVEGSGRGPGWLSGGLEGEARGRPGLTRVLQFQVVTQGGSPHPDCGRPKLQPPPPRLDVGARSFHIQLWVVELLWQGAPDHWRHVPVSRVAPKLPPGPARPDPGVGSPAAATAQVSPAPPSSRPAGRRLLRDVRRHAGVSTHRQGQSSPEAPHAAQSLAELPHLGGQRAAAAGARPTGHPPGRPPAPSHSLGEAG